jgi:hypothetical protein
MTPFSTISRFLLCALAPLALVCAGATTTNASNSGSATGSQPVSSALTALASPGVSLASLQGRGGRGQRGGGRGQRGGGRTKGGQGNGASSQRGGRQAQGGARAPRQGSSTQGISTQARQAAARGQANGNSSPINELAVKAAAAAKAQLGGPAKTRTPERVAAAAKEAKRKAADGTARESAVEKVAAVVSSTPQAKKGLRGSATPNELPTTRFSQARAKQQADRKAAARAAALTMHEARAAAEKISLEKRAEMLAEQIAARRMVVSKNVARRRDFNDERVVLLEDYVIDRENQITEDKAYRTVSKRKSAKIKVPRYTFSPGNRQGVTRGKKRGSAYYKKVIAKAGRSGRRGGGGGGKKKRKNNNY